MPRREVYTADDLREWPEATADVRPPLRLAVFGDPVAHSASPPMHDAALAALNIDARYTRVKVASEQLAKSLESAARQGFLGANLTIPHKVAVMPLLASVDERARQLGAVNTVSPRAGGKWHGSNTDGPGFVRAVRAEFGVPLQGLRVMILGAARRGGARDCRAVHDRGLPERCARQSHAGKSACPDE